jgi:hypothetical protein
VLELKIKIDSIKHQGFLTAQQHRVLLCDIPQRNSVVKFFNKPFTICIIFNMRKLILSLAVSLDGFIEGPKGEYDWCITDPDYGLSDFFKRIDTLFIGRKTYGMSLAMWEIQEISGFPKFKEYIFSTTLGKSKRWGNADKR